nr:cysteine peptidase family C39 domain-containing protein [Clostridium botulinum]
MPLSGIAHVIIDKTILHYVVIHKITEKEIIMVDPDSLSKHHQFELV